MGIWQGENAEGILATIEGIEADGALVNISAFAAKL